MFPCEMARYIAGFSREARKSGASRRSSSRSDPELRSDRVRFSISDCSAGISWPLPARPVAAAEPARGGGGRATLGHRTRRRRWGRPRGRRGARRRPCYPRRRMWRRRWSAKPGVGFNVWRPAVWALQAQPRVSLTVAGRNVLWFSPHFKRFRATRGDRTPAPPETRPGSSSPICFQGVSFALGLVTPGTGPVVAGVWLGRVTGPAARYRRRRVRPPEL